MTQYIRLQDVPPPHVPDVHSNMIMMITTNMTSSGGSPDEYLIRYSYVNSVCDWALKSVLVVVFRQGEQGPQVT